MTSDESIDLNEFISQMPLNSLNDYYDIESSVFKKRIEKLNLKFYWESEALNTQKEIEKPYNKLFLILFKQISLYLEEIDRLNIIIIEKNKNEKSNKEKIYDLTKREKDRIMTKQMLNNYQKANKLLEKRIKEKMLQEDKYRLEIEKMKQQIQYFKEQVTSGGSANIHTSLNTNQSMSVKKKRGHLEIYQSYQTENNKRSYHSIENRNLARVHNRQSGQKANLNQSMTLPNSTKKKTGVALGPQTLPQLDANDNEEMLEECLIHYNEELEQLNEIEMFLFKEKQNINDAFLKQLTTTPNTNPRIIKLAKI